MNSPDEMPATPSARNITDNDKEPTPTAIATNGTELVLCETIKVETQKRSVITAEITSNGPEE